MELLVGVLCESGVVVGSPGEGTASRGLADHREGRAACTLLVDRDVIVAGAGRAGLAQRFADVVHQVRSDSRFRQWTGLSIAKTICAEAVDDFASTRCEQGQFGAIVAFPACDGFQLCEFPARDLQPEMRTPRAWFAWMGSGGPVVQPFLSMLQRTLFADGPPSLPEGVFVATWVLDYALGQPAGPRSVQVAVLAEGEAELPSAARFLTAEEIAESFGRVRAAERHLAELRAGLFGRSGEGTSGTRRHREDAGVQSAGKG